jgi:protein TonB
MSALTFESFSSSPRRNASRRISRPVNKPLEPVVHQAAVHQAAIASIRDRNNSISKGNKGAITALVVATVILHIVILNAVNRHGPIETVKVKSQPIEIDIAPPPPPPEPPKPIIEKIKPVIAPAKIAPTVPIVRSDVPIDSTPSPDAVQVAPAPTPPAPAPAPAVERVTEPRGFAGYLNNPAPAYPPAALLKGLQGHVILNVHVLASGHAEEVTVFKTSGQRILDDSAIKTVSAWLFDPAKRGDSAIDGWVKVPINFKIS